MYTYTITITFVDVVWLFLYAAVYWWGSDGVFRIG
ncbi:MAG: hypothetical protein EOP45_00280 [Sphingobacteriaceae bacterium]|nr:MAG: hypothetical protein EOP45_00280 [Sphingobacteriaceae bacterium]